MTVRPLPELTDQNGFFWHSGADGQLRFLGCSGCGFLVHPPGPVCPRCLTRTLAPVAVSGRATVAAFTINARSWIPGFVDPPYVVAVVELDEQPDVRLTTQIVNCAEDVRIGMPVRVTFEAHEDVYVPLFEPASLETS